MSVYARLLSQFEELQESLEKSGPEASGDDTNPAGRR